MRDLDYTFLAMNSTAPYPLFLKLGNRPCVVAGLGAVGCRKLAGLLAAGAANVLALDLRRFQELSGQARELLAAGGVKLERRGFEAEDARPGALVFAATSDRSENLRIARLCARKGALCNCATDPQAGDFIVPAIARKGRLTGALSTAGQSPALSAIWREELEKWLAGREKIAWLLGRLRGPILALGLGQEANAALFRKIAASPAADWLAHGEIAKCRAWLGAELPAGLAPDMENILTDYVHAFR